MEIIVFTLIPLAVVVWIIVAIARALSHPKGAERKPITLDEFKKVCIGTAIAILLPLFVNLTASSISPNTKDMTGFALALILSLGGLTGGYFARKNLVVGGGVITGSLVSLLYAIGVRFIDFDVWTQLIIVGTGLIVATFITYFIGGKQTSSHQPTTLDKFKNAAAGIIILSLAILFATTANNAFNPAPRYPDYSNYYNSSLTPNSSTADIDRAAQDKVYKLQEADYQSKRKQHDRNSFVIILGISLAYLILGLLVRNVGAVSVPFIISGLGNIIYILTVSFDEFGNTAKALICGIGVVLLIAFSYWKLEHKPETPQPSSSTENSS